MQMQQGQVDLAILGGGPAGYVAALRAAQLGASVALVEEREVGGVCLNRGCIPTKALLRTAQVAATIGKSREFGINSTLTGLDWMTMFRRKDRVVRGLRTGVEQLLSRGKVQVLNGRGTLLSSQDLLVVGKECEQRVLAKKVILATGSHPRKPPVPGVDLPNVITSDEALELPSPPESVLIIGAGVIGVEFASFFRALGIPVTLVEMTDGILPGVDCEASNELAKILRRQGVQLRLGSLVKQIDSAAGGLQVIVQGQSKDEQLTVSHVLLATGRALRSDEAGLPEAGLAIEQGAVVVDRQMQTNLPGVYAAGDLVGGQLLAHVGFMEGRVAAENALGRTRLADYSVIPACIYSFPELATVGMSEEAARLSGHDILTGRFDFRGNGKALGLGERDGFVKVIVDKATHSVLGGVIVGAEATELISELALAVRAQVSAEFLAEVVHPHPTLAEAVMEAAADAIGQAIHR